MFIVQSTCKNFTADKVVEQVLRNFPKCLENFSARRFEISEKVVTCVGVGVGVDSFDVVDFLIFGTTRSQPLKYFLDQRLTSVGGPGRAGL